MSKTYGVSVKQILAGAPEADGSMSQNLADVGKIYKDSVSFVEADPSVTRHFSEGSKYPFLAVLTSGELPFKFTIVDISADNLAKWLGGAAAANVWNGPAEEFSQELSLKIVSAYGTDILVCRAFVYGKITWNMTRTEIAKIDITAEVMLPEDGITSPVISQPSA